MKLSVIVITKNEAAHIVECLDSVSFADEFIVVDSGSTDNTVELARDMGATVLQTADWPGFGPQKNRALDLAQGEWVLSIDADERVTPELAAEICRKIGMDPGTGFGSDAGSGAGIDPGTATGTGTATAAGKATDTDTKDAYEIPRLSEFCGRFIRHSGWWPDPVLRLFRRGMGRFTDAAVHEKVIPVGTWRAGRLKAHFIHYSYPNLDALIAKSNRYSSDAAMMMYARGKRASIFSALGHGFWTFIRIYLIRRGFLDGRQGVVLAVTAAAGSFARYAKLMFLNDEEKRLAARPSGRQDQDQTGPDIDGPGPGPGSDSRISSSATSSTSAAQHAPPVDDSGERPAGSGLQRRP